MINPASLMRLKGDWEKFISNHPKFPMFMAAVRNADVSEGTVIEVNITTKDGKNLCTNVKLTQSDLAMIEDIKQMAADR